MRRILIIDNSIDHTVYNPLEHWEPLLVFPFDAFRMAADEIPDGIGSYSHVILTGSEASVLENTPWIRAEEELIRTLVDGGHVILGSCFGHQMIARSLFGVKTVRRMPKPEIGWPEIRILTGDRIVGPPDRTINSFVFHLDEVCRVPDSRAIVLARSEECRIQALKLKDRPVWGIQPHPEIGIAEGLRLVGKLGADGFSQRENLILREESRPVDSGWIVPLIREFQRTCPMRSNPIPP